ncbi:MAG: proteasome subunit alpha, partial [Candidatus Udaeobacter sp.]
MEGSQLGFDQNLSGSADDFPSLMRRKGLLGPVAVAATPQNVTQQQTWQRTDATTILAFKFSGGVLVAGDRRATAGNTVVYDRADKVLEIDSQSIMAIAGVPATAWEMARVL